MNALNAYNKLNANVAGLKKSSEKLSSGYRINRAGDDAAGLAVSEKMRSQIRGLNQAVRNSQDGINMIQTFEGAAQETHSILQRMKELASESANGTYDNYTDRAAMQLEFEQLNDELNQIADTDFNGTVVLNGGEMADGLKAVDGEFDYANKADQLAASNSDKLAALQAEAQSRIDAATKAVAAAQKKVNGMYVDLSNNGAASEWNTVDNNGYGAEQAELIFGKKGDGTTAGTGGIIDPNTKKNLADLGATSVTVTFKYNGSGTWTGLKGTAIDADGNEIELDEASLAQLTGEDNGLGTAGAANTGKGGFNVKVGTTDTNVNALFDSTKAKAGDTVTLTFTNVASETVAPKNMGMDADSYDDSELKGIKPDGLPTFTINVTDDQMNDEIKAALDKLDNAFVRISYSTGEDEDGNPISVATYELMDENDQPLSNFKISDTGEITYTMADGKEVSLATVTAKTGSTKSTATTKDIADSGDLTEDDTHKNTAGSVTLTWDGDKWVDENGDPAGTSVTVGTKSGAAGTEDDTITITDALKNDNDDLNVGDKLTITSYVTNGTGANKKKTYEAKLELQDGTSGSITFGLAVEHGNYDSNGGYTVKAGKDNDIDSDAVVAAQKALAKAQAELDAAKAAYPESLPEGVTKADAFDNSTARMTYTENIVLQTGARTKDAVNFTFSYNRDGTADMGDLKANLNLSSREDGLNTANLSLATQKDANHAIDQIDKAINKTSMVRATFGAIQNRLEHKITNLTTTSENLQEAESSIRDTDMASEMMNYTKFNILQQAAQSMLAQANQQPQSILQLLG